ncbi:hypothetical protein RDI58_019907 [Solanum bulbocastanum]|uniref:Uncharacterized protein n=1 Tax=Solanum bulbocastanum TaxID=147425 RepID=A0AAN8Y825_SOLBU
MHLAQFYDMVNFEIGLATLRAKVKTTTRVKIPHYPMAKKSEEGSHDLHFVCKLRIVKEIMTRLPQRLDESSSGPRSYAYVDFAKSHGELSISHNKMKKLEKSKDKFFTRMWKWVKGLWKVLKANEPLPTSRPDEDGYELATWRFYVGDEDIEATNTYG